MSRIEPVETLPKIDRVVVNERPTGCDVWVVVDGREHKLWKHGHRPQDPPPVKWAATAVQGILDAEEEDAVHEASIIAEKEPSKIDALLAFAKANPDACETELIEIARKKLGVG